MLGQAALCVLAVAVGQVAASTYPVDFIENVNQVGSQGRVVSGWEAYLGQHPHQVSLRMIDSVGSVSGCGGNVISRQWILTAAHCTATRITIVVRAGLISLTRPEVIVETSEYYNHFNFDSTRPLVVQPDDIGVVKLPIALRYTRNLRPIRLTPSADANKNYDRIRVHASGFGRTWTNGPTTEDLRWVYLRGVSNFECASVFTTRFVTPRTVCARYYNVTSQSICQGDSGGPLVHVEDGVALLIGVSSFVAGLPHGCHSGLPAGFVRVAPFHDWFKDTTGIDFEDLNEEEEDATTTPLPPPTTTNSTTVITPTPDDRPTATTPPNNETTSTPPSTTSPTTTVTTSSTTTTTEAPGDGDDDDDEDDPELSELLKKLEVKVKVMVRLSKSGKKQRKQIE